MSSLFAADPAMTVPSTGCSGIERLAPSLAGDRLGPGHLADFMAKARSARASGAFFPRPAAACTHGLPPDATPSRS